MEQAASRQVTTRLFCLASRIDRKDKCMHFILKQLGVHNLPNVPWQWDWIMCALYHQVSHLFLEYCVYSRASR